MNIDQFWQIVERVHAAAPHNMEVKCHLLAEELRALPPVEIQSKRLAVYAGSFDPLTTGHSWMIEQGVSLFDRLVVAMGINPRGTSHPRSRC
jgi:cytidyltransferase-like protein